MTKREAIILTVFTDCILIDDFPSVHKFCQELLGYPVQTFELADKEVCRVLREKCRPLVADIVKNLED